MGIRTIYYTSNFAKQVKKLPHNLTRQISQREEVFRKDPFHPLLKTHKLSGKLKNLWSFSITFHHRILFEFVDKDKVLFIDVGGHEIYG